MKKLLFLSVLLFASLAFSQGEDTTKTIVVLKPVTGPQLHFRMGDYIVSCPEKPFLEMAASHGEIVKQYLYSTDTLGFEETRIAVFKPMVNGSHSHQFSLTFFNCLEDGNAGIYRISDKKTVNQIAIKKRWWSCSVLYEQISEVGTDDEMLSLQLQFMTVCF